MKNSKVIILAGFARGGTNIAWNLLQSHPQICSPIYETGEHIRMSRLLRFVLSSRTLSRFLPFRAGIADRILYKFKLSNLTHLDNRYISEDELYTVRQIADTALCLKSVNHDIFYTDALARMYPGLYFIAVVRNGYALCDGYLRRGKTAAEAGVLYNRIASEMKNIAASIPNFKLVKFEDIIDHPFEIATELFEFVEVDPATLPKLRLKSKKVITSKGQHKVVCGQEHRKYWFTRNTITDILQSDVNKAQMSRLHPTSIRQFQEEAEEALTFFGYDSCEH